MIVVVEDNVDIANLWRMSLGIDNDVVVLHDGLQAMEYRGWGEVTAVILDVQLGANSPSGLDVMNFLHANYPHIKAVIVTATPLADLPEEVGVVVLQKPSSLSEIRTAIEGHHV